MSTTSDSAFPLSSLPSGRMVLSGVTVVDTRTGSLAANQSVVLEGGKIQQIVPAGFSIKGATHSIDAQGKFVVPGYLDMHTHSAAGGACDRGKRGADAGVRDYRHPPSGRHARDFARAPRGHVEHG